MITHGICFSLYPVGRRGKPCGTECEEQAEAIEAQKKKIYILLDRDHLGWKEQESHRMCAISVNRSDRENVKTCPGCLLSVGGRWPLGCKVCILGVLEICRSLEGT